jgi:glucosamine-6-phosphate deaminase
MPHLNLLEETRFEKLPVTVCPDKLTAAKTVAKRIAEVMIKKATKGENAVLGFATGITPILAYSELVHRIKRRA